MKQENTPFAAIKLQVIKEMGEPVTDYSKLDFAKHGDSKITEFFIDNFKDLKMVRRIIH